MKWDEVKELAPLYALGALDKDSIRQIENFLRTATSEQRREVMSWQEVSSVLPDSLPSIPAPAHIRSILIDRIKKEPHLASLNDANHLQDIDAELRYSESPDLNVANNSSTTNVLKFEQKREAQIERRFSFNWMLAAASILMMLSTGYLYVANIRLKSEIQKTSGELAEANLQLGNIYSKYTKVVALAANKTDVPEYREANAKLVWNQDRNQWQIYIFNLPEAPQNKSYQLWYVTNDTQISAAVFDTDRSGRGVVRLDLPKEIIPQIKMTAVTIEPKGGSKKPTLDQMVLSAKI